MASFTYISGELKTIKPYEYNENELAILVAYTNKKAVVNMPIRISGSLVAAYKDAIKNIDESQTVHIEIFGDIFISKKSTVYIDAFRFNITNATKLYEDMIKKATPKTYTKRRRKRWKKSSR